MLSFANVENVCTYGNIDAASNCGHVLCDDGGYSAWRSAAAMSIKVWMTGYNINLRWSDNIELR